MSETKKKSSLLHKTISEQRVGLFVSSKGYIDIDIFNVQKEDLEAIAKATGKEITEHRGYRWIDFARARDKSKVTLFEA